MKKLTTAVLAVACCALAAPAEATSPAPDPDAADAAGTKHTLSITFSPIHLIMPMGEIMVEYRLHDIAGLAVILGAGSVPLLDGDKELGRATAFEGGAQGVIYALGDFDHGMQLGAELLFLYMDARDLPEGVTAAAGGLSVGPFAGYKIAASFDLTLEVQLGVTYMAARAKAESTTGETASNSASDIGPLLNLNLGWSF